MQAIIQRGRLKNSKILQNGQTGFRERIDRMDNVDRTILYADEKK